MRIPEDNELTGRINARDEQAFLALYDRYSSAIYRHTLLRVGSRQVAEDVVSHTFLKTWEYLRDPGHTLGNAKAFLFRVAHNHIVDHWRDKERAPIAVEEIDLETRDLPAPSTFGDAVDRNLDVNWLRERLAELPPAERQILLWRYVDELPIGAIAELSGKTRGATYVAIHRARRLLERKVLDYRPHQRPS